MCPDGFPPGGGGGGSRGASQVGIVAARASHAQSFEEAVAREQLEGAIASRCFDETAVSESHDKSIGVAVGELHLDEAAASESHDKSVGLAVGELHDNSSLRGDNSNEAGRLPDKGFRPGSGIWPCHGMLGNHKAVCFDDAVDVVVLSVEGALNEPVVQGLADCSNSCPKSAYVKSANGNVL